MSPARYETTRDGSYPRSSEAVICSEMGTMTKVLYIEHDDDNLYMLKMRLERVGGLEVLAAEDSEKGCKLAATEHPDVILMDLEMPVVDRWEPVRTLKNDPHTRDIPIIGMSACAGQRAREGHCHGLRRIRYQTDRIRVSARHHSARCCEPEIIRPLCWSGWRAAWQAHGEYRSFARFACHCHIAAHHARELARDGKTQAGATKALRRR